jgi:glycosyltransferase involved in cell wall biosynthesis
MSYTPLSVVIITYNEEQNIARCIQAIQAIADDIVVVDSYSTDRTVMIAQQLGARVVSHAFEGHIQQKNFAITQALFTHIFSLDADEYPDQQLVEEIRKVKINWDAEGYSMNRLNNYCGRWIRHGAWYPDIKLRLWDSRKGRWEGLNPHDRFTMEKGVVIRHLAGDIRHHSYTSVAGHKQKVEYFSSIAAQAYFQKGVHASRFRIVAAPVFRFIRDFFLKRGFLDGRYGFIIARLTALEVMLKYRKLRRLQQDAKQKLPKVQS